MNSISKRFLGVSFIIFAVIGIIISLIGVAGTWQVRSTLLPKIIESTELINSTLSTTYDGMGVLYDTLEESMETLESTEKVLFAMARTMGDINDLSSNFLRALPLILPGLQQPESNPEVGETPNQFEIVETEMDNIANNFKGINYAMTNAQGVATDYQEIIDLTKEQIVFIQTNVPRWITTTSWILTILLIWFAITQIGFIYQGLNLYHSAEDFQDQVENKPH